MSPRKGKAATVAVADVVTEAISAERFDQLMDRVNLASQNGAHTTAELAAALSVPEAIIVSAIGTGEDTSGADYYPEPHSDPDESSGYATDEPPGTEIETTEADEGMRDSQGLPPDVIVVNEPPSEPSDEPGVSPATPPARRVIELGDSKIKSFKVQPLAGPDCKVTITVEAEANWGTVGLLAALTNLPITVAFREILTPFAAEPVAVKPVASDGPTQLSLPDPDVDDGVDGIEPDDDETGDESEPVADAE